MSDTIQLTIPTIPVAQPRQRHRVVNVGGRALAMNYTPAKHPVQQFKSDLRTAWARDGRNFGDAPIVVCILLVFPRPKSKTKKRGDNPRLLHTSRPDWDNVGKAVCDALTGFAWNDDAQVCDILIRKRIAAADESPHVDLAIGVAEIQGAQRTLLPAT